jgi:hypothetical protein
VARRIRRDLACGALCAILWGIAVGAQSLDLHVGFSSSVVASQYAPVRVDVTEMASPVEGILRITQRIGALDADPEVVTVDLYEGALRNGTYHGTVPIYDPLNPIEVTLLSSSGQVLAEQSVNIRLFQRTSRFPVVCGAPISLGGLEIIVSPSELPVDWWAYEPVDSLWINGGSVSSSAWEAIARWVYAGGSLVVFTGDDFYQIDSAVFRSLFPLESPELAKRSDGTPYLRGEATDRIAETLSSGPDGTPLLYQTQFGAGIASVVAVRAADTTAEELAAIGASIPRGAWYSLLRYGSEYRNEMRVPRPIYMIAPSLVLVLLACVWLMRWGHLRQAAVAGSSAFRISVVAVGVVVLCLSVWSGLYANRTKQLVELFSCRMTLQTHTAYGISLGYVGLLSPAMSREVIVDRTQVSVPSYALLKSSSETSFGSTTDAESFRFAIHEGEARDFRFYGTPRRLISFEIDRATARVIVSNNLFFELDSAFVVSDGAIYRLGAIPAGGSVDALGAGRPWESISFTSEYGSFLEAIIKEYRLSEGTWLLALVDHVQTVPGTQVPEEVRDIQLHIVEEGSP